MVWLATLKKAAGWGLAIGLLVMANWSWAGCTEPALVQQAKRSSAADDAQLRYWIVTSACAAAPAALYVYRIGAPYRSYAHITDATGTRRIYLDPWLPTTGWTDRLLERLPSRGVLGLHRPGGRHGGAQRRARGCGGRRAAKQRRQRAQRRARGCGVGPGRKHQFRTGAAGG